ncbi:MAG TPA: hypothetical protein VNK04_02550 [Gemmataceae bacterium]|nr:hypothetical protein [Gemmataceae bacterium]
MRQKLVYDLYYVCCTEPLLDLQILLGTVCDLGGIPVVVPAELS